MSSSSDNDQDIRVVAVVLIAAILLAVGTAIGFGISKARGGAGAGAGGATEALTAPADAAGASTAAASSASADAAATPAAGEGAAAASDASGGTTPSSEAATASASDADASVVVDDGVVKFYFASGKADLPAGAADVLADAVAAAKAGKKLVISGFHDATGNADFNAELAKKRAFAVRDALKSAGVAESSIELRKPEVTTGSGNDAEARRVEVMIAQ